MISHFILADQEYVNRAQVVEIVLENQQDTIWVLSIAVEWFVKKVPKIVHLQLGYMKEVHKDWCLEVLFHFFSHLK